MYFLIFNRRQLNKITSIFISFLNKKQSYELIGFCFLSSPMCFYSESTGNITAVSTEETNDNAKIHELLRRASMFQVLKT